LRVYTLVGVNYTICIFHQMRTPSLGLIPADRFCLSAGMVGVLELSSYFSLRPAMLPDRYHTTGYPEDVAGRVRRWTVSVGQSRMSLSELQLAQGQRRCNPRP
jgi:hypothetical protein